MLEVAQRAGVSEATVSRWESGDIANMRRDKIVSLANALQVTPAWIMGWDDDSPTTKSNKEYIRVPVLGYVAAGVPIEAVQDILDYEELDPQQFNPNYEYFGLKIKGESMTPRIQDGDVVIVRRQPTVENGNIAIVCVNGDEATCKQIKITEDGISLISFNPSYPPMFYTHKEVSEIPITFMGKVVELRGKF